MKRKDAAPLSSILDAFLESLRIPHVAFLVSLRKRWPEIAGPLVSRNATPLSVRNGVARSSCGTMHGRRNSG